MLFRSAFSTRIGGSSGSYFASMNLGFNRGDPDDNVKTNYSLFCEAVGIETKQLVFASQTHSTVIRNVGPDNAGEGFDRPTLITGYDGLSTGSTGLMLATLYADCVPLYFYDPVCRAVALSHAGWRGTLNDMAGETIRHMTETFGTKPQDLLMGIGPSIGPCCFEVGADVAYAFRSLPSDITDEAVKDRSDKADRPDADPADFRPHIDLQLINRRLAQKKGVRAANIETAGICTACNSDLLFSHRASEGKRGSLCAVIGIKVNV